ncbi:MAG: PTS sugar transporter subunit IIA [[Clostridium] innocuum]
MIKILIVTHGPLAQALKESSAMFFGSMSNDVETIGLYPTDNPEDLKEAICEKVEAIDTGDGVTGAGGYFRRLPVQYDGCWRSTS